MSDHNASGSNAVPVWKERKNLLLAGGVGVAVLLIAGYFLLSGGSSDSADAPIPSAAAAAQTSGGAGASPSASASATATVPPKYDADAVYGNPFKTLYVKTSSSSSSPSADGSGTGSSTGSDGVTTINLSDSSSGSDTGSSNTGSTGSDATPTADSTPVPTTVTLKLVDVVDSNTVKVTVNGTTNGTYHVGDSFGTYFSVLSTVPAQNYATFNFGDGSPFSLSEGHTIKFIIS